jgi:hypothetical protein
MKNLLLFTLMCWLLISCDSKDQRDETVIDTNIEISVTRNAVDLLNAQNQDAFHEKNIRLFHMLNGSRVDINDPKLDYPKGFMIYQRDKEYRMRIFPYSGIDASHNLIDNLPTTYIQWNETDVDTITCALERKSNSAVCKKVWFNTKLVWESNDTERFFEVWK